MWLKHVKGGINRSPRSEITDYMQNCTVTCFTNYRNTLNNNKCWTRRRFYDFVYIVSGRLVVTCSHLQWSYQYSIYVFVSITLNHIKSNISKSVVCYTIYVSPLISTCKFGLDLAVYFQIRKGNEDYFILKNRFQHGIELVNGKYTVEK